MKVVKPQHSNAKLEQFDILTIFVSDQMLFNHKTL